MLIDIHVHTTRSSGVTRQDGSRYPTPDELLEMMDAAGVDRAVVLSTISPEWRSVFITPEDVLDICAEFPDRLIPFASVDPRMLTNSTNSNFTRLLEHYKQAGCKGIGEYSPNLPFDDPLNMNVFRHVEEAGLPLTFHLAPKIGGFYGCYDDLGLPRLENALKQCPDLVFLAHSQVFWSEISNDVTDQTRGGYPTGPVTPGRVVELMHEYPNLHGDLSAGSGHNAISRDPDFGYQFLEEFQDRLYFGTDIGAFPRALPVVEYFQKVEKEGVISEAAYDKITWRNAADLLGLGV